MKIMRKIIKMSIIVYIITLFFLPVSAEEACDADISHKISSEVAGFIEDFSAILPDGFSSLADSEGISAAVGVESVLSEVFAYLSDRRGSIVAFFLLLIGSAVLSGAPAILPKRSADIAEVAVSLIASMAVLSAMMPTFSSALLALLSAGDFFTLLIPLFSSVTVAGGGVGAAELQAAAMGVTASLISGGLGKILTRVCSFGFAIALLSSLGDPSTAAISRGVRNLFAWLLGILTTLTVATLSLQTTVATAADSAAMRAARYAAQSAIPVVGSMVSGALSTLASGLSYARGIIGGGAVAVLMISLLSPFFLMLIYRFALSLATTLSDFFDARVAARVFGAFRYAADSVIAVYASLSVVYIFEAVLFLKSGVAVG